MLVMASSFGLQHMALPLIDWQTSLSRFVGTFLKGLFVGAVYLKQRHLLPLTIAHWGLNFVGIGLLPLLWVLSQ
jgi:membrane protease YdiL (CAAX protease family)